MSSKLAKKGSDTPSKHAPDNAFDHQFTGNYPRYSGAITEVTGGPPEDINEMPASEHPQETPIYDGSDLKPGTDPKVCFPSVGKCY